MNIGISLGKNCDSAEYGVNNGVRLRNENGYNTCPFDLCVTHLKGVVECLKDDFKYFCNPEHLAVINYSIDDLKVANSRIGEELIKNTYYNFIFNHESPGHTTFYTTQNWLGGKYHFVNNNFKLFIERYERRINNFRIYLKTPNAIISFILKKELNDELDELNAVLSEKYPELNYKIILI